MSLDPDDWDDFRKHAHRLLDSCVDHLVDAENRPWRPVDDKTKMAMMPALPIAGGSPEVISDQLIETVMPHATGNTHPKFFGWVHGTGLASGLLAEMVAATMNSNCGGRDHGASYIERCVIDWSKQIFSFPDEASGLLTVGTSQATIIALACARAKLFGTDIRKQGISEQPPVRVYCRTGTHSCIAKALELMGHGSNCVVDIPTLGVSGPMDFEALKTQVIEDRQEGFTPLAVVGTAGSVNTGAFDDLESLAAFCKEQDIWLHVDGAFGAWIKIAKTPWSDLVQGIEKADSLAFDFHKWMSIQYDCGAVLIRDGGLHYDTFATRPAYLAEQETGLGGGDLWFCDFGIDLSRGFRALKVWTALQEQGLDAFSASITCNCEQASYMAKLIEESTHFELAAPVISNVCTFSVHDENLTPDQQDKVNENIVHTLQMSGRGVFSTTTINNAKVIRAAIVNHRTRLSDIDEIIADAADVLEM